MGFSCKSVLGEMNLRELWSLEACGSRRFGGPRGRFLWGVFFFWVKKKKNYRGSDNLFFKRSTQEEIEIRTSGRSLQSIELLLKDRDRTIKKG
jgi:hypothetical protein